MSFFVAAMGLLLSACDRNPDPMIELQGPTMGTYYSVKIARPPAGMTPESIQKEVIAALDQVVSEISTYDPKSELSRLNANQSTDWIEISSELYKIITQGQRIAALTDGVYDITIGPLVNLWGFGPESRPDRLPTQAEINAAKARVGWQKLELRESPPAIRKARGDIYIDLSSMGEGLGVDRVSSVLDASGAKDYMVAVAGTIRAKGQNASRKPWGIAVEQPLAGERSVNRIVPITDRVISTSGDYRNFFEKNGKRYSHEVDPRTGAPVDRKLGSVTLLGDVGVVADGLATALMVLGDERGPELAKSQGLAAYFIVRDGEALRGFGSPAFESYLKEAD